MKEFTMGKSLTNVNSAASALLVYQTYRVIKEFTLEKSLMNVKSVASALLRYQT